MTAPQIRAKKREVPARVKATFRREQKIFQESARGVRLLPDLLAMDRRRRAPRNMDRDRRTLHRFHERESRQQIDRRRIRRSAPSDPQAGSDAVDAAFQFAGKAARVIEHHRVQLFVHRAGEARRFRRDHVHLDVRHRRRLFRGEPERRRVSADQKTDRKKIGDACRRRQQRRMVPTRSRSVSRHGSTAKILISIIRKMRPAGARLKTMGGQASGPEPLRQLLAFARGKILAKQGKRLSNIDVHDICCKIGDVRRGGRRAPFGHDLALRPRR